MHPPLNRRCGSTGPLSVLLDSVLVVDISSITTPQEVEHVVGTLMSGLRMLRDTPFYKFGRDDLLDAGRHLETLGRALYAAQIRWVGEIEDTGTANQLSCSSTRALLRDTLRISSGDAADRIRAAKLTQPREPLSGGNIPPRIPLVGASLDNADIGAGHVAVITKAVSSWPQHLDPDTFDSAEQLLVAEAQQVDPGQLARTAQRLEGILDPDGPAPDEPDPTSRMELRLGNRNPRTRLTPFTGTFTDEAVEMFRQANAALAHGGPITTGQARRILCDARILPAVLNGASKILDLGRSQRIYPPHLRDALVLRDGGCAWPGCDRPAGMTQAHHIISWLDGGPTSLANGVLLCLYHHQQAHSTEWEIRIGPDNRPEFIPPPWIDPHQQPRRNHHHHPLRQ